MTTVKTRKPIDRLTQSDLRAFPVWAFADDEESLPGRDETWVRPIATKFVPVGRYSLSVVSRLTTACGREFNGVAWVNTDGVQPQILGGSILYRRKYLPLPDGTELNDRHKELLLSGLRSATGLTPSQVFPVRIELLIPIRGMTGTIGKVLRLAD